MTEFQIMPDIPPERRGLDHWATPIYLSLHKAYMSARTSGRGSSKYVTVMSREGKISEFESVTKCAKKFKTGTGNLSVKIARAIKREDHRIKLDGEYYTLVLEV